MAHSTHVRIDQDLLIPIKIQSAREGKSIQAWLSKLARDEIERWENEVREHAKKEALKDVNT
ncbi:MAG: hypothetical protein PHQ43_13555 [Dehalococcoidales bacterium]|nr:hypothetical protein [Dehalococcoidales bacterium]